MYEILDYPNPPLVGSLSWGGPETIPFYDDPNFQAALDVEFMKAGVMGITMVISAGDFGAGFIYPGPDNFTFPPYTPIYPASSTFILF